MMKPLLFIVIFLASGLLIPSADAALNLSINPIDGGSGIRFERVLPGPRNTKQLQIRVSSTDGKKYQVFQRVFDPIINEKGQSLNLSSVETAALAGSNTSGTLYLQNIDHLSYSEQLLYTSGQGGESDSFMMAYNALPETINGSGTFRGKIVFTVRALGESDQSESVVDFFLESTSQLEVSVVGGREFKRVRIKDRDTSQEKADFVKIAFANNNAQNIKIYQEVTSFPTNQSGIELSVEALRVSVEGSNTNVRSLNDSKLSHSRVLIYSGEIDSDEFVVYFLVNAQKIELADAGFYNGQVKYIVETNQGQKEFTIDIECDIQPLFTMDVTLPPEGISFGHVLASSPAQEKQVIVTVRSNLRKPYQVLQNMTSPMVNEQGKEFDKKNFTFKVDITPGEKGRTKYVEASSVDVGEYPIYYSDAQGSPVSFTVSYQIQGYFDMNPGNFIAPLKYSLNQN